MTEFDRKKLIKMHEDALIEAKESWIAFFKRYGFEFPEGDIMDHESNIVFARVVETELRHNNRVDFPIVRKMFMLGYLKALEGKCTAI